MVALIVIGQVWGLVDTAEIRARFGLGFINPTRSREACFSRANWKAAKQASWHPRSDACSKLVRDSDSALWLLDGFCVFFRWVLRKLCPNNHRTYHKSGAFYHVWYGQSTQAWRTKFARMIVSDDWYATASVVGAPVPGVGDGWDEIMLFGKSSNVPRFQRWLGVLKVQKEQLVDRFADLKAEHASQMDGLEQNEAPIPAPIAHPVPSPCHLFSTNSLTKWSEQVENQWIVARGGHGPCFTNFLGEY